MTGRTTRDKGSGLLTGAAFLLLLLAAAQGYVSFRAQYTFVNHAKHARVPSMLEALGLDAGAVIFALLALSLARRGRSATVERVLNVACALGSLTMNLLAANLTSPRSVTVWVLPSALYTLASDRLIAVVRRWVQSTNPETKVEQDGSAWRVLGGLMLWFLRLVFDARGTLAGFRRWVLTAAPVAPGTPAVLPSTPSPRALPATIDDLGESSRDSGPKPDAADEPEPSVPDADLDAGPAPGEKKREALIRLYERCGHTGDPRYGDRTKVAELAGEIAGRIGYHPGTARRELARYLASRAEPSLDSRQEADLDAEAVA